MADHHTTIHQITGQLMGHKSSTIVISLPIQTEPDSLPNQSICHLCYCCHHRTSTHYDGLPQEVLIMNLVYALLCIMIKRLKTGRNKSKSYW